MSVHDGGEMNGEGGPREDEESGGGGRREKEREKERGPWRCSLVARSTNCQVIGPVPPLV